MEKHTRLQAGKAYDSRILPGKDNHLVGVVHGYYKLKRTTCPERQEAEDPRPQPLRKQMRVELTVGLAHPS